jgi:hypothetical protein
MIFMGIVRALVVIDPDEENCPLFLGNSTLTTKPSEEHVLLPPRSSGERKMPSNDFSQSPEALAGKNHIGHSAAIFSPAQAPLRNQHQPEKNQAVLPLHFQGTENA